MQKKCLLVVFLLLSTNIFLFGCADDAARAQIADTNARLDKLQGNVRVIDNKVSDQKMINVLNKLDSLQNQINELNGSVSTISHDQKTYQATQDQLNQSIEQQIQGVGTATSTRKVIASEPEANNVRDYASSSKVAATSGDLKSALKKIKNRNFPQAIKELKNIIATSQDPETVQNATYYLSVTYAANNQYKDAIGTGRKFATDFPNNPNAPDALRIVYISQNQLGMVKSVAKTGVLINQKYPNSDAAKKIASEQKSSNSN